jgi:homoserine O-acetyltransferase
MKPMLIETQYFEDFFPPNELVLESGEKLGAIKLAYETYGTLNFDKSNAILICHALSGDAHVAFEHKDDPAYTGWWNNYVGPNKAIDTDKYFVICSNVIGGCKGSTGPNSINPKTQKPYGLSFPVITIADMVHVQKKLIDYLQIKQLKAAIGGSMGGMQVLEWSILYPEMLQSAVVLASTARTSTQSLAFDAVGRHAIISDQNWQKGDYYAADKTPEQGLAIARMIGHLTYLSDASLDVKFGRKLQEKMDYGYDFGAEFQIESYLKYQGNKFVYRFDANSYLYLTKAISYFDLVKKYGSMEKAFAHTKAKFLVVAIKSDWLYPPNQSKKIVKTLLKQNKEVTYFECDSPYGHDAFLLENQNLTDLINFFLTKV